MDNCDCPYEGTVSEQFPVIVRKVDGSHLSREELRSLADYIRDSYCPEHGRANESPE